MSIRIRIAAAFALAGITMAGVPLAMADTPSAPPSVLGVVPYIDDGANSGGNVTCDTVNGAYVVTSARLNYSAGSDSFDAPLPAGVTVTVTDDTFVAFTSVTPIAAVIVKGSDAANVYDYVGGGFGLVTADSGLASPPNSSGGSAGLSNLTFCAKQPFEGGFEELTVTKTATTSYARTWNWSLTKSASTPQLDLYAPGGGGPTSGTVGWTVSASATSTDSNWAVSGDITIENTGTLDATVATVSDMFEGTALSVVCPDVPFTIEPEESVDCSYTEALAGPTSGTNTATVTTATGKTYEGTATVTWGDPTTVIDATMALTDSLEGDLGTVAAPGATFTYSDEFVWTAPGCSSTTIDNTATLTGAATLTASASVVVRQQCRRFVGETAWAAGARYSRTNWATFTSYPSVDGVKVAKTVTLFAGQTNNAGTVTIEPTVVPTQTRITVVLGGQWRFRDAAENLKIQGYATAPSGTPSPGLFASKFTCDATATTCTALVPTANFYGVHADVGYFVYSFPV